MSPDQILFLLVSITIGACVIVAASLLYSTYLTRLRIKNGYPLETVWGKPVYPRVATEEAERISLLTQENARLRAEIGAIKDRLANVERIVTDSAHGLAREIDRLRDGSIN